MVPGSTLRYGSSFCIETLRPRATSRLPRLEAVRPLPSEEATPPVTKRCLVSFARGPTGLQPIAVHQGPGFAALIAGPEPTRGAAVTCLGCGFVRRNGHPTRPMQRRMRLCAQKRTPNPADPASDAALCAETNTQPGRSSVGCGFVRRNEHP